MAFENKIKLQSCRLRFGWFLLLGVGALTTVYGFAQESEKNQGVTTSLRRESVKPQAEKDAKKFKTREGRLQAKPLDWNATIGKPTPRGK
jgi:hypothetical protein